MKFPKHFTLEEMTVSQTAARAGLDNIPTGVELSNLSYNATMMEFVRQELNDNVVIVNSGYRSPEVNAKVGGAKNSAHTKGLATDFICPAFGTPLEVAKAIAASELMKDIDQLIHEYDRWVHVGWAGPLKHGKQQLLTINKSGTKSGLH